VKKKYSDESEIQRDIVKHLNSSNKQTFNFEITPHDFDIIDTILKIFIETKIQGHAPSQLIYAIVKKKKQGCVNFLGLANIDEIRFYKAPSKNKMEKFAKEIDPTFSRSPSGVNNKENNIKAFKLIGKPWRIYTYEGNLDLSKLIKEVLITEENYDYFEKLLKKYNIDPMFYLTYIADILENQLRIRVNSEGRIYNEKTFEPYHNKNIKQGNVIDNLDKYGGYKPIKNIPDKRLFEMLCIKKGSLTKIKQHILQNLSITIKRSKGHFFTKKEISENISKIIKEKVKPDYIIEPYVGAGALIVPFLENYQGVGNDNNSKLIEPLRIEYSEYDWVFTCKHGWKYSTEEYIKLWNISKDKNNLIYFNPPFGTTATNLSVSKKDEIKNGKKSRKIKIDYANLGDTYGRGDLVIPAIGRMIEIIKKIGSGYLAFFCPAGIMFGRIRYYKVLKALLQDFEFIEGHICDGNNFKGVASKKSIAFTIWKYHKNINTDINSLVFKVKDNKFIKLKKMVLLKNGWKYSTGYIKGELAVQRNERFNTPLPKGFYMNISKGGSELIPENVKIDLCIQNVPSELAYGLWSTCVGYRSITNYPNYIDNAYIHLPDFSKQKISEILAYLVIHALISELIRNYCKEKIGFDGLSRKFKFGNKTITNGAKHLIDTYGYCKIGNKTIIEVFNELKEEPNIENINKDYRKLIKKEIEKRLETIGYWDYIPIPKVLGRQKKKKYL